MSANFQALLDTLNNVGTQAEDLHKALPAAADAAPGAAPADDPDEEEGDDAAIQAAAAEAAADKGGDGAPIMKSMQAVDENGNPVEAVDATELLKSLQDGLAANNDTLAKALTAMTSTMEKQGALIKSLTARVSELSSQGRGRKTVVSISEKPGIDNLAKSTSGEPEGMSVDAFFAKANAAFDQGKLSGRELTVIDVCRRENKPIDPALISKVVSA